MCLPVLTLSRSTRPSVAPMRTLFMYVSGWHITVGVNASGMVYSRGTCVPVSSSYRGRSWSASNAVSSSASDPDSSESEDPVPSSAMEARASAARFAADERVPSRWSSASLLMSHPNTRPPAQME